MRLIDVDALSDKVDEHCKRHRITAYERDLIQHYLDEEMAPGVEAVPLKPLAKWLAGRYIAHGYRLPLKFYPEFGSRGYDTNTEDWEQILREKDWEADE